MFLVLAFAGMIIVGSYQLVQLRNSGAAIRQMMGDERPESKNVSSQQVQNHQTEEFQDKKLLRAFSSRIGYTFKYPYEMYVSDRNVLRTGVSSQELTDGTVVYAIPTRCGGGKNPAVLQHAYAVEKENIFVSGYKTSFQEVQCFDCGNKPGLQTRSIALICNTPSTLCLQIKGAATTSEPVAAYEAFKTFVTNVSINPTVFDAVPCFSGDIHTL